MGAIAIVEELLRRVVQRDIEHAVGLLEGNVWLADLVADGSPLASTTLALRRNAAGGLTTPASAAGWWATVRVGSRATTAWPHPAGPEDER